MIRMKREFVEVVNKVKLYYRFNFSFTLTEETDTSRSRKKKFLKRKDGAIFRMGL